MGIVKGTDFVISVSIPSILLVGIRFRVEESAGIGIAPSLLVGNLPTFMKGSQNPKTHLACQGIVCGLQFRIMSIWSFGALDAFTSPFLSVENHSYLKYDVYREEKRRFSRASQQFVDPDEAMYPGSQISKMFRSSKNLIDR